MIVLIRDVVRTQFDFLLFRSIRPDLENGYWTYFALVVGITWVVGIGRYWDHPSAELWQYAGLGSVTYIFVLATVLYLVVWPLGPRNWRYSSVLIFVGLTALPAALYAFPIEKFVALKTAQVVNAWFLGIVAIWRVALYMHFLATSAKLHWFSIAVATILPLSGIVTALALLNLEHVMFNIMGGIREAEASPYDTAYEIVILLTMFAFIAFPVTIICYVGVIVSRLRAGTSAT